MAQAMAPDPGALYPQDPSQQQGYSGSSGILGALYGPASDGGWQGPGGLGNTLQNIGAGLHSISDPAGGAAMAQQANAPRAAALARAQALMLANKPQYVDGGTDMFGQKNPGYSFSPMMGKLQKLIAQSQPGASGGGDASGASGGPFDAFKSAASQGATGDALLQTLPKEYQGYMTALRDGRAIPGNMGRGQGRAGLMIAAQTIWPDMDEANIQERQTQAKNMASDSKSQIGGQLVSSNTLINHLGHMWNDIDNLEKLGVSGKYLGANFLKQAYQDYTGNEPVQSALAMLDKHRQAAAGELVALTRGGGGSLQEVQDWKNGMNAYDSTAKLRSGVAAAVDLMHGRIEPGVDKYNRVMGKTDSPDSYLTPGSRSVLDKISGVAAQYAPPGTGTSPSATPQGAPVAPTGAPANPAIAAAQAALAKGAPRAAVLQRLKDNGIDPGGL